MHVSVYVYWSEVNSEGDLHLVSHFFPFFLSLLYLCPEFSSFLLGSIMQNNFLVSLPS